MPGHVRGGVILLALLAPATLAAAAPSDAVVARERARATQRLGMLVCFDNRRCPPATPAELADPPVSLAQARAAIERGMASEDLRLCGRDWRRLGAAPFLRETLAQGANERRYVLTGELHEAGRRLRSRELGGRRPPACAGDRR